MSRKPTLACMALLALFTGCSEPVRKAASWTGPCGATASVELFMMTEEDAELAVQDVREAIEHIDELMMSGRSDNALGRLNLGAAEGYHAVQDPDLYRCLVLALDYAEASRGAFDPTIGALTGLAGEEEISTALQAVGWEAVTVAPEARAVRFRRAGMRIDLGGVAPGFSLDAAARVLTRPGSRAALLRLGGNYYAWNRPPGREAWALEIEDPRDPERELLTVQVANRGVAVSGPAAVLDPRTGRPAVTDILAAIAIADSAADADALSTALVVSGYHRATDLLDRMRHVEALLLVRDEPAPRLLASGTLAGRLEISAALESELGGAVRYVLPPRP